MFDITKKFDFKEMVERLRKVSLKARDRIDNPIYLYRDTDTTSISIKSIDRADIYRLYTAQPLVYRSHMERVVQLDTLLKQKTGCSMFSMEDNFFDITVDDDKIYTLTPPIVEEMLYPVIIKNDKIYIDYQKYLHKDFVRLLSSSVSQRECPYPLESVEYIDSEPYIRICIICDGSHRIAVAEDMGIPINVILIKNILTGFPYYAFPLPYHKVILEAGDEEKDAKYHQYHKIHIFSDNYKKYLYRYFPSGGIHSGNVRK